MRQIKINYMHDFSCDEVKVWKHYGVNLESASCAFVLYISHDLLLHGMELSICLRASVYIL